MRTSELRASSPSFMTASPRASLRLSTAASGGGEETGLGSPYAAAAAGSGGGAGAGSLPSSPLARDGGGGSSSFAFARRGSCYRATSEGMDGFGSPSQASAYMQVRCLRRLPGPGPCMCCVTCCCRVHLLLNSLGVNTASVARPGCNTQAPVLPLTGVPASSSSSTLDNSPNVTNKTYTGTTHVCV